MALPAPAKACGAIETDRSCSTNPAACKEARADASDTTTRGVHPRPHGFPLRLSPGVIILRGRDLIRKEEVPMIKYTSYMIIHSASSSPGILKNENRRSRRPLSWESQESQRTGWNPAPALGVRTMAPARARPGGGR